MARSATYSRLQLPANRVRVTHFDQKQGSGCTFRNCTLTPDFAYRHSERWLAGLAPTTSRRGTSARTRRSRRLVGRSRSADHGEADKRLGLMEPMKYVLTPAQLMPEVVAQLHNVEAMECYFDGKLLRHPADTFTHLITHLSQPLIRAGRSVQPPDPARVAPWPRTKSSFSLA